jgi:GLPGLI family protein
MKQTLLISLFLNSFLNIFAQDKFISRGNITYEVKVNNHKNLGNETDFWTLQMKESSPKISTYFYNLKFNNNTCLFSYTSKEENVKKMWGDDELEENIWYNNFDNAKCITQKSIFGEVFLITDSTKQFQWKLIPGETRDFAGFNCKKAMTKMFDSVYVFAFYTEDMLLPNGPMNFGGLPGTILGITIPRLNMSCVATSFSPLISEKDIAIPKNGKQKTAKDLYKKFKEATKDWGTYADKAIWQGFL